MRKFNYLRSVAAAVAAVPLIAALATPLTACAQSIDYGSLESLFGEPVTTSATGSPQRSTEVPVDMTIISADEIKRSGAHDLPTLLGRVAGLDVLNWSSQTSDVGVRGFDQPLSPRLLVLVNGRQVYLDHYGYTAWSTLPVQMSEIRQIEVVKGPNAALFGFNAVSGVVNIITYNPKYDTVNNDQVSVSSRSGTEVSAVHTWRPSPRFAARFSAGAAGSDEWDNTAGLSAQAYRARPSRVTANIDAVASLSEHTELRFETSAANSFTTDMLPTYDSGASKYATTSVKLDLTSETPIGLIQATAYRNSLSHKLWLVYDGAHFENNITDLNIQDLFKVGAKHTFRIGVEARHNEMNTSPVAGGTISYNVASASAMWAWAVSDTFNTSIAVRSDNLSLKREGPFPAGFPLSDNANWDRDISRLSYNIGAVWHVSDKDSLRLMGASGAQLPSLIELGGLQLPIPFPGFTVALMGNPSLAPSVVDNVELSYDHSFTQARAGLRLFSQTTTGIKGQPSSAELFQYPTLTTYPAIGFENVTDSKMSGFEVSASGHFAGAFRWSGDYTHTDVSDQPYAGHNLILRRANNADMTPKDRANASLGWAKGKWTVDGFVHYTSTFTSYVVGVQTPVRIKGYTTLAANVGVDLGRGMSLAISGQNLFKSHQRQTPGLEVPSTIFVTLNKSW